MDYVAVAEDGAPVGRVLLILVVRRSRCRAIEMHKLVFGLVVHGVESTHVAQETSEVRMADRVVCGLEERREDEIQHIVKALDHLLGPVDVTEKYC